MQHERESLSAMITRALLVYHRQKAFDSECRRVANRDDVSLAVRCAATSSYHADRAAAISRLIGGGQ